MNKKFILVVVLAFVVLAAVPGLTQAAKAARATKATKLNTTSSLATIIAASDKAIGDRVTSMNNLITRINGAQKLTSDQKTSLTTGLQNEITQLNTLKAKIDADTDATTALADAKTIKTSYRIYMLVDPQAKIAAASDRAMTISGLLSGLETIFQARIATLPAGTSTTAIQTLNTDMVAKLTDANTQAQAAVSAVSGLQPDNGVKTVIASNLAAIKGAIAKIKTMRADISAARKDAGTIASDLKAAQPK